MVNDPMQDEGSQQQAEYGQQECFEWLQDHAAQVEYQQYLKSLEEMKAK